MRLPDRHLIVKLGTIGPSCRWLVNHHIKYCTARSKHSTNRRHNPGTRSRESSPVYGQGNRIWIWLRNRFAFSVPGRGREIASDGPKDRSREFLPPADPPRALEKSICDSPAFTGEGNRPRVKPEGRLRRWRGRPLVQRLRPPPPPCFAWSPSPAARERSPDCNLRRSLRREPLSRPPSPFAGRVAQLGLGVAKSLAQLEPAPAKAGGEGNPRSELAASRRTWPPSPSGSDCFHRATPTGRHPDESRDPVNAGGEA
jgi:hypothetical protein